MRHAIDIDGIPSAVWLSLLRSVDMEDSLHNLDYTF